MSRVLSSLSLSVLLSLSIIVALPASTPAQTYLNAVGNPSFGVNLPVPNGYVNIANGNLHLEIPLSNLKQRGSLQLNERLVYDSRIWEIVQYTNYYWWPMNVPNSQAGWRFVKGNETGTIGSTTTSQSTSCWNGTYNQPFYIYTYYYNWTDPSGTIHPFSAYSTNDTVPYGCTTQTPGTYISTRSGYATDASGYYATVTSNGTNPASVTIRDGSGTQVYPQVIDRFGNFWSSGSGDLIDDRGQTPIITTQNGSTTYYDVLSPNGPISNNGTRVRYTVTTQQISLNTSFNQSGVTEYQNNGKPPGSNHPTVPAITSIGLPDGSSYSFAYDSYGMIQTMTLPTGGTVNYGWANYTDSYQNVNRWLTSSTVDSYTTSHTPSVVSQCSANGTGCKENVNVHRPSGDETVYTLTLNNGAWDTNTTAYLGAASSNVAKVQTFSTYKFDQPCTIPGCNGAQNVVKTIETTTLPDVAKSTQMQMNYADPETSQVTNQNQWDYYSASYDSSGNPTVLTGTPSRSVTYGYTGFDLTSELHKDSAGNPASQTNYNYTTSASASSNVSVGHGTANSGGPYLASATACTNVSVANCNTSASSSVTTSFAYDDAGMVRSSQDAKGNAATTFQYDPTDTYAIEVDKPSTTTFGSTFAHVTKATFDPATGAMLTSDDENSVANNQAFQVQYTYEAVAGRLQKISLPKASPSDSQGGSTTYSYPSPNEVDVSTAQTPTVNTTSSRVVDGYGRAVSTTVGSITSTQVYDSNGRPISISTPKSGSSTTDGTAYTYYDALSRVSSRQNPDGSARSVQITGNIALATDEVGNQSEQIYNAFGELTSVLEVDPNSGSLTLETDYTRDGLGNVTCVEQHGGTSGSGCSASPASDSSSPWRVRRFYYNALSQLKAASIPEHKSLPSYPAQQNCGVGNLWTDCYSYDPNGNLSSITDNRGVTNSYTYDTLDRPLIKNSPSGTTQDLSYDAGQNGIGHLWHESNDVNAASTYGYDALGRLVSESSCRPSNCGSAYQMISATYDLAGNRLSTTYPDGRVIADSYDSLNRLSTVSYQQWGQNSVNSTYWTAGSYTPPGLLQGASYGNGVQMQAQFNNRLTLTSLSYQSTGSSPQTYFNKSYSWDKNAMNLLGETNQVTSQQRQFGYDKLNRLITATDVSSTGSQSTGTATVSGHDGSNTNCPGNNPNVAQTQARSNSQPNAQPPKCTTQWDSGNLSLTVNGFTVSTPYTHFTTATSLATSLTSLLNASGSPVTATSNGSVITITSVALGSSANYSMSWSTDQDFTITLSGPTMTGGQTGSPTPSGLNQQYTLDAWGNLSSMGSSGFSQSSNSQNQVSGYSYDAAGRLQSDTISSYTYDDDGMILSSSDGSSFIYDAMNQRAQVSRGGSVKEYYYFAGQLIATRDPSTDTWTDMIYAGGQKVAWVAGTQTAVPNYVLPDYLGSGTVTTDNGGNVLSTLDYTPFGQLLSGSSSDGFIFTGLERDANGLDHADFRQYSSVTGRWITPDPSDGSYNLANPQSMNRYVYTGNPLYYTDRSGLCAAGNDNIGGTTMRDLNGNILQVSSGGPCTPWYVSAWRFVTGASRFKGSVPANHAPNKDVPLDYDIFHCPTCANTWNNANNTVQDVLVATVAVYAAVPVIAEVGTTEVGVSVGNKIFGSWPRGFLNGGAPWGNWLRIGMGGVEPYTKDFLVKGGEIFRVSIGGPKLPFWIHFP